ncbi:hypothetical protein [Streptomyces sp. NPDC047042]|uniref:hypothetical protein n=1 Tax=Streptomyces sp. NPDC047042 TaxID=3154807 RepID=UPI0034119CE2
MSAYLQFLQRGRAGSLQPLKPASHFEHGNPNYYFVEVDHPSALGSVQLRAGLITGSGSASAAMIMSEERPANERSAGPRLGENLGALDLFFSVMACSGSFGVA